MPPDDMEPLLSFTSAIHKTNTNRLSQAVRDVTKTPGHTTVWVASTQYHCLVYTGNLPSFFGNPSNLGILDWHQFRIPTLLFKARFRKSHFGVDCSCLPISSRLLCLHTKQTNVYQTPFYFPYGHLDYTWPQPSSSVYRDLEFSTQDASFYPSQTVHLGQTCVDPDSLPWVSQNGVCASPPPHVTVQGKKSVCLHWWLMGW